MTIDQIREIVISPDAIMKKEWGKVLLDEIDRLTAYSRKLLDENIDFANEINRLKARVEKAEATVKQMFECKYEPDKLLCIYESHVRTKP